jgi:uncharacterized membrane protein YhhN
MDKKRIFLIIFSVFTSLAWIVVILNIYGWGVMEDFTWYAATKPPPMGFMILTGIAATILYQDTLRYSIPVTIGLITALIGDIFLLWNDDTRFILGVLFNLITHIFYSVAYVLPPKNILKQISTGKWILSNEKENIKAYLLRYPSK